MGISDHIITETVTEVEDKNESQIAEKKNEYRGKQIRMYKWYEEKGSNFK
jgi:hypothetical protein